MQKFFIFPCYKNGQAVAFYGIYEAPPLSPPTPPHSLQLEHTGSLKMSHKATQRYTVTICHVGLIQAYMFELETNYEPE